MAKLKMSFNENYGNRIVRESLSRDEVTHFLAHFKTVWNQKHPTIPPRANTRHR